MSGPAAFLVTLFRYPDGIVLGNLIASAMWAPLGIVHLDRLAKRHHREHLALMRRHHRAHMAAIGAPLPGGAESERET
jgi:hypothetical protein